MTRNAVIQISSEARLLDKCAEEITHALQKTVEGIFETGRLLVQWRKQLEHGEWMRLFEEHRVPISVQTAERFMRVWKARTRLLSPKSSTSKILPPSHCILDALASLPEDTLAWAQAQGRITPNLQMRDVRRLRTEFSAVPASATAAKDIRTPGSRLFRKVERLLVTSIDALTVDDRAYVITMLQQLLKQLETEEPGR